MKRKINKIKLPENLCGDCAEVCLGIRLGLRRVFVGVCVCLSVRMWYLCQSETPKLTTDRLWAKQK